MWACKDEMNSAGDTVVTARRIRDDIPLNEGEYLMKDMPKLDEGQEYYKDRGRIKPRDRVQPTMSVAEKLALIGLTIDELATAINSRGI